MHLVAAEQGLLSASGVVGGTIPLALGSALACQQDANGRVVAVFFGDGAANTGSFHESLNIATLWQLPLILVCENNGYAEFTPMSAHTVVEHVSAFGGPYGLPTTLIDGNDVVAVHTAVSQALAGARAGKGPTLVECLTYRLRGHYVGDPETYRRAEEVAEWREKDPIRRLSQTLLEQGALTEAEAQKIGAAAKDQVAAAVQYALESPFPDPQETVTELYL